MEGTPLPNERQTLDWLIRYAQLACFLSGLLGSNNDTRQNRNKTAVSLLFLSHSLMRPVLHATLLCCNPLHSNLLSPSKRARARERPLISTPSLPACLPACLRNLTLLCLQSQKKNCESAKETEGGYACIYLPTYLPTCFAGSILWRGKSTKKINWWNFAKFWN